MAISGAQIGGIIYKAYVRAIVQYLHLRILEIQLNKVRIYVEVEITTHSQLISVHLRNYQ